MKAAGLDGVQVVAADAGRSSVYEDLVPADLALVCGVFGNISDADIQHTVRQLPRLCRTGATVIWTRHREPPDLTPRIRAWFAGSGFAELGFDTEAGFLFGVGAHRLTARSLPYLPGIRLFDAVQEALLAAATRWPEQGVPDNPRSWLITVASRRMTDQVRSEIARRRREESVAATARSTRRSRRHPAGTGPPARTTR